MTPANTKPPGISDLDRRAAVFKALGHPTRLLMVNLSWEKARHGEELAAILKITPATASFHLAQLVEVGLLLARRDPPYQMYAPDRARFAATLEALARTPQPPLEGGADPYRQKVLRSFMRHGRLVSLPAQRKKRDVILEKLAEEFEFGRDYPEREVNLRLAEFFDDFFTLRRELIGRGLMTRDKGIYRRVAEPELRTPQQMDDHAL